MTTRLNPIATLVVDDSEDECQLLRAQLRYVASVKLVGFVHDGIEAISYLRGLNQYRDRQMFPYPELMLLDFKMPRCNGMEVLEFLQHRLDPLRVIFWSTALHEIDRSLALNLGADMVCAKPRCLQELVDIIRRIQTEPYERNYISPVGQTLGREPMHA